MGIERLEIKGFRSLRDVVWEPGRLNVLIGPNASGKSNLLDACFLLQDAVRGNLDQGIVRRGGITPLLWDQRERSLSWHVTIGNPDRAILEYGLGLERLGPTGEFRVQHERLHTGGATYLRRTPSGAEIFSIDHRDIKWEEPLHQNQTLLSMISNPLVSPVALSFEKQIESWSVYYDLSVDEVRQASVARIEKRIVVPDGRNLTAVLHTLYTGNREFRRVVDAAMHAAFGEDYDELLFPPAADQRVQLRLRWSSLSSEQSAADLSDGTLRFLILIAILADPDPGALIAIDEPETGLHPRMFSILAELAQDAAERTQVVFTTHSPQFLDAFTGEPPTTTVTERVDGETRLKNVDGEELRRWLREYSLGSLFSAGDLEALA